MKFEVGDRVLYCGPPEPDGNQYVVYGDTGTVCKSGKGNIGVCWDNGRDERCPNSVYFHSCNGTCDEKRGWFIDHDHLELYYDYEYDREIEVADDDLFSLL